MTVQFLVGAGAALLAGVFTSISPCPLATNVAAVSFLARDLGRSRRVLLSGLLYTLGRAAAYVALAVAILHLLRALPGQGGGLPADQTGAAAEMLLGPFQKYLGLILGPVMVLAGMFLLGLIELTGSLRVGGQWLQQRVAGNGALWSFPLGVLFALSFCPTSVVAFGALIVLSVAHASPVLLPTVFGVGTAVPVIGFAFLIAFAGESVGKAFNSLSVVELWVRRVAGAVFLLAGLYYMLTHIYGLSLLPGASGAIASMMPFHG